MAQDPKKFLEMLEQCDPEKKLKAMTTFVNMLETGTAAQRELEDVKQQLKMYKDLAEKRSEEIINLKVQAKLQAAAGGDSSELLEENGKLRSENDKLRRELEQMKSESGDLSAWEDQKKKYEKQISDLQQQLAFQTKRADDLGTALQSAHETSEGLAAQVRTLNEQIGKTDNAQAQLDAMQKKLDANIAAKRELEQKIKDNEKTVKAAGGSEKRIAELQEEVHKKEVELKKQIASVTEWQRTAAEWETQYRQAKTALEITQHNSAQRMIDREAKVSKGSQMFDSLHGMPSVGGQMEVPKLNSAGVPYMKTLPKSALSSTQGSAAQQEALDQARYEAAELKKKLETASQRIEELTKQKNELSAKVQEGLGNAELEDENAALKRQVENLKKQSGDMSELDSLKTVNATQKEHLEKLVKEKEALEKQVKELSDEVKHFKTDSADSKTLTEENQKLQQRVKDLEAELDTLKKQLAEKDEKLKVFLKEEEEKQKAAEAARAAASSSYEMRMSTLTSEVEKHEAKYLTTNIGFEGRVRIKGSAPRKKAYFVMVENQVFPNPYLFREMTTGKQSYHTLQQLKTLFDVEGLDNENMTYRLVSVVPAVVYIPDGSSPDADNYEMKEKGKLKVERQI